MLHVQKTTCHHYDPVKGSGLYSWQTLWQSGDVVNGITYVVTGGGGAPLYDVGNSPWTVYSEKTYHYCLLTTNSSLLTFEAIKPDGTVFDSFMIPK